MAYALAGTGYLTVSTAAITHDVGTIAAWLKPAFAAGDAGSYYVLDSDGARFRIQRNAANQLEVSLDGLDRTFNITGLWSAGQWVHIAVAYNKTGPVQKLYINGTEVSDPGSSGAFGSTAMSGSAYLGSRLSAEQFFDGSIAEVGVWSVRLDDAEIAGLAKAFSSNQIRPASLNAYWKLLGNASPERDDWKNGYAATLVNSPTKADHPRIYYPTRAQIGVAVPGFAIFEAAVVGAGTTSASLTVGAGFSAAVTGAGVTSASLSTGARFTAAVTGAGTTSATFAELVPVGVVTVRIGIALWRTRVGSLTIRDLLNAAPNTCGFTVKGTAPTVGQAVEVRIGNGTITTDLLFAGSIMAVAESYEGRPENLVWQVTCQDHTRTINRRKVRIRYAQQSATAIALDLIDTYTTGFTTDGVVAGLPTVTGGIDFTEEDVLNCLTRLASRIGGYSDVDYLKDVRLFLTEASDAPDPLQVGYPFLHEPAITPDTDVSQLRSRVYVEGGGSQARNAVAVGATSIPVTDASWYSGSGGIVVSGPQRITYTGKGEVGGPSAPTGAQSLVVGNLGSGAYTYKVSLIDSGVESPLSSASAAVTIDPVPAPSSAVTAANGSFAAPSSAPTAGTPTTGGSVTDGAHTYATTFVTATGETTASPSSGSVTARVVSPSGTEPSAAVVAGTAGNMGVGAYKYKETFINAAGETTPSSESSADTIEDVSEPNEPSAVMVQTAGNVDVGNYWHKVTYVTTAGETSPGAASDGATVSQVDAPAGAIGGATGTTGGSMTPSLLYNYYVTFTDGVGETTISTDRQVTLGAGESAVNLTGIQVSSDGRVTGRKIYRFDNGTDGEKRLVATIGNNTATTHTDTMSTAARGATSPLTNTTGGGRMTVTIPTSGDGRVTGRKIYRATSSGGTYKLLTTINDNSTTSYQDNTATASLGADAPSDNTSGTGRMTVTIHTSGDATVTARKIYRTVAGGSTFKLLTTINNNSATSYDDNSADGSLGADAPSSNTATVRTVPITAIPTGPSGTTSRKLYRTAAGGSQLKLLATISGNVTTTYNDTVADGSLGANVPTTNTAGGSLGTGTYGWKVTYVSAAGETTGNTAGTVSVTTGSADLTSVPVSADARVTARNIYRTTVGGSTYLYEGQIANNSGTTFASSAADGELGSAIPGTNTTAAGKINLTGIATGGGGVSARKVYRTVSNGSTYKLVATISDNVTTTLLDNVADGSLGVVAPGDIITALTGIPASGPGSVLYEIPISSDVNILEQCDDVAAQTALAAMEGGDSDGIYEHFIQDRRLASAEARATGNADLALFAYPIVTLRYATRDPKTRSGKTIHVDVPELNILGDFTIQSVVIDQIGTAQNTWPRYTVEASSVRFSIEDVLRRLQLAA